MPVFNNALAGAAGQAGGAAADYVIPKSLRFNPGDSAYLNKVFSTSGNRRTYTLSFWHKQTTKPVSGTDNVLFGHMVSGYQTQTMVRINGSGQLEFGQFTGSWNFRKITSRILSDPASFYHIVISVDTTNATAEDRIKIYVNGVRETEWSTNTNPAQNLETLFNSNVEHGIGKATPVTQNYCNGLLADIQFVDGQALTADDFGETRSSDGVWVPKEFTGDYNAPAVGVVYSDGVSSPQGIQSSYPVTNAFDGSTSTACTNVTTNGSPTLTVTFNPPLTNVTSLRMYTGNIGSNQYATGYGLVNGTSISHSTLGASYGAGWVDFTGHFSGTTVNSMGLGQTNAGTNALGLSINAIEVNGTILTDGTAAGVNGFHLNFSDSSTNEALGFDSAPTTPDPDPKKGMDVITYAGSNSPQNIGGLNFEPGLVWIKRRTGSGKDHCLVDVVRGPGKRLRSESTAAETTENQIVTSFDPGGFTIGTDYGVNQSGYNFVAWNWAAGGPAVANTSGTTTSQVSANTDYGFSIVTYTGGTSDATIGHGLGQTPKFYIVKARTNSGYTDSWNVYHTSLGESAYIKLNTADGKTTGSTIWNNTAPTSTVFSVDASSNANENNTNYVAYVWSEVAGYSKFGSYTGNGSEDGPFIQTGFKPRWILIKSTYASNPNAHSHWLVYDTERSPTNEADDILLASVNGAEFSSAHTGIDILDNGFKLKGDGGGYANYNTNEYIYAAFADRPGNNWDVNNIVTNEGLATNKDNFDVVTYTGNGGTQSIGGPVYSATSTVSSPTNVFNNNTGNGGVFNNAENRVLTAASITINSSLEIYHNRTGSDGITVNINGTDYTATGLSSTGYHTIPIPNSSLPLTTTGNITIKDNVSNAQSTVYAVRVDGNVLVDGTGAPLKFKPDFVWIKERGGTKDHNVYDVIRGTTKELFTNGTGTENTLSNGLTSFGPTGFTLGSGTRANGNNQSYVAWCLKAGGTAVSNTDGSITSSVSANPNNGFSIVTASPSNNAVSIGHGLSTAPRMIISKSRTVAYDWNVYHASLGGDELLRLNTTAAKQTVSNYFNSINSSTFSVTSGNNANNSGDMVYYCFADVPGYQKVGSWIGNGSSTGPVVITGFRPKFLLFKRTDGTANWYIYDTERQAGNPVNKVIPPNTNGAEYTMTSMNIDFLNNGFQLKGTDGDMNNNNSVYIYLAIGDDEIGSDEDCLVDVPNAVTADADATDTTGGYQRGNYATLNPLDKNASATLANGNLDWDKTGTAGYGVVKSTIAVSSGKWYCEYTLTGNETSTGQTVGVTLASHTVGNSDYLQSVAGGFGYYSLNGNIYTSTGNSSYGNTFDVGDTIGIALDMDNGKLFFSKNGVFQNSGNPASGTNPAASGLSGDYVFGVHAGTPSTTAPAGSYNFGQMRFKYPIPDGYKTLNTTALPPATIGDGSDHFEAVLYDGTGAAQTISGLNLSPDMAWIKERNGTSWHRIVDVIRGQKEIFPNANNGESSFSQGLNSFNSDGFTLGTGSDSNVNTNNNTYVAWLWDAGSTTDTNNTDGDITPTGVRANQAAGFSIVKFTGPSSAGFQSVGHGLNAKPELIICKDLDNARNWSVYHKDSQVSDVRVVPLNQNVAAFNSGTATWDISEISNTTFTPYFRDDYGASYNADNIAYCFAPVSGFSAFGKFEGNGSNDGPFVYTGFAPAFVMFRRYDAEGYWIIFDNKRNTHKGNYREKVLYANTTDDEENSANGDTMLFLSNGFKLNNVTYAYWNANGGDYLWAAFAENPFQANGGLAR